METVELLEKYFETAFAAPDGVKRLRESILSLAMRGKLVPQDPQDRPASELLQEIAAEKKRLIKEGKIKKSKPLPEIKPEDIPYELPGSWRWVRVSEFSLVIEYGTCQKTCNDSSKVPVYRMGNIVDGHLVDLNFKYIDRNIDDLPRLYLQNNDILFNRTNSYELVGKTALYKGDDNIKTFASYLIRVKVDNERIFSSYVHKAMNAPYFRKTQIEAELIQQCGQANFNGTKLSATLIPLPPLEEQRRIVEKIDRLMAMCDRLEKLRSERDRKRIMVQAAAIDRLLNAGDRNSLDEAWSFIRQNFNELYCVKENITQLRKAILQLAVMGKLVPQDPNDRPASELLKEIEAEKKRLIKEGKIKKQKPLPEIKPEEIPYDLPKNWEWVRLEDITSKITDGDHKTPTRISQGYRLLSAKNVRDGYLDFDNCDFIREEDYLKSRERCLPECGDLLIVSVGGTIGRSSLVPQDSNFALVRSVALIKPTLIHPSYLKYSMDSSVLQDSIHSRKRGGAQPCLYLSEIKMFPFSVPPLPEQHRIVAKVDRLMELCDRLERESEAATEKQNQLLEAIAHAI
jgi:type I restriction enzyme, S subunit